MRGERPVAFVVPVEEELAPYRALVEGFARLESFRPWEAYGGRVGGRRVGLVVSDCGPANAGAATHTEDLAAEFGALPPTRLPYHFDAVLREVEALHAEKPVDLAIGDTRYSQRLQWVTEVMEFGFPSHFDHALHPRPTLGFEGWTCFLDRVARALTARRWGRR